MCIVPTLNKMLPMVSHFQNVMRQLIVANNLRVLRLHGIADGILNAIIEVIDEVIYLIYSAWFCMCCLRVL